VAAGKIYAINDVTLFAVGATPRRRLVNARQQIRNHASVSRTPNPFAEAISIALSLPSGERVKLEVLDTSGRLVSGLVDADLSAGDHTPRWEGRDTKGRRRAASVYFARLTVGSQRSIRRIAWPDDGKHRPRRRRPRYSRMGVQKD
jgi:hypothetical protein